MSIVPLCGGTEAVSTNFISYNPPTIICNVEASIVCSLTLPLKDLPGIDKLTLWHLTAFPGAQFKG